MKIYSSQKVLIDQANSVDENDKFIKEEEYYYNVSYRKQQRAHKLARKKSHRAYFKKSRSPKFLKMKEREQVVIDEDTCVDRVQFSTWPNAPISNDITIDNYEILPAESLGLEEGPMYERLLSILEGDDITPEDYDLLLQLDNNNVKTTMDNKEISEIKLLVLGDAIEEDIFQKSSTCDICLESFKELPKGTQVRQLPCNHVFCKECIDYWFSEVSTKCPNLSCYWHNENCSSD